MLNYDNTWPTEELKAKMASDKDKSDELNKIRKEQTIGLYNLGNTCYLNAAM
jgi:ubiquitin C-terminal hydrolase